MTENKLQLTNMDINSKVEFKVNQTDLIEMMTEEVLEAMEERMKKAFGEYQDAMSAFTDYTKKTRKLVEEAVDAEFADQIAAVNEMIEKLKTKRTVTVKYPFAIDDKPHAGALNFQREHTRRGVVKEVPPMMDKMSDPLTKEGSEIYMSTLYSDEELEAVITKGGGIGANIMFLTDGMIIHKGMPLKALPDRRINHDVSEPGTQSGFNTGNKQTVSYRFSFGPHLSVVDGTGWISVVISIPKKFKIKLLKELNIQESLRILALNIVLAMQEYIRAKYEYDEFRSQGTRIKAKMIKRILGSNNKGADLLKQLKSVNLKDSLGSLLEGQ